METSPALQPIRFDVFEVDLRAGELRKHGIRIRLQEQPFLILEALLETPGQIVTREELQKRVWPGDTFVDFDHGLHAAVNRLRQALNDAADSPRFVETVARRGYRFIGQVEVPAPVAPAPIPAVLTPASLPKVGVRKPWMGPVVGFAAAVVVAALLVFFNAWGLRNWFFGSRSVRSLAVLPLDNLSADSKQDYFADGMTEDLITQLSKLGDLKVISHTSVMRYKGSNKPLPQIARELNVDAVLEGAVQLSGNHVRINAQLVDGRSDQHIWADGYDRDLSDVLLLQSDVARDIAKQIDLKLTPQQQQRLAKDAHPVNPDAYQSYLLGRYYWNKRTADGLAQAGKYFQQAIQQDPNYAPAYAGLSDYFAFLTLIGGPEILPPSQAMMQAKAAAVKAVQLDDSSAEAHASMGHILHNSDWDFDGAEREFKRAIELNPNYATVHHWYAHMLMQVGRTDESLAQAHMAQELDPLSPFINNGLARQYYLSRQYDKAIAQCRVGMEIDPTYLPARTQLALAYEQKGMFADAVSTMEEVRKLAGEKTDLPMVHALLAHAYALAGRRADAQSELSVLAAIGQKRYVPPSYLAIVYLALGDKDKAFSYLNKGYQDRSEQLLYLGVEPLVDPLRGDPRFDALLKQVGLKR